MKAMKRLLAAVLAVAMTLAFAACGNKGGNDNNTQGDGNAAAGSKVLNVMIEIEVGTLDPQLATAGTDFEVIADFTDGLMQMDANGVPVEAIAESYDISEDQMTYTFHLREDAVWSNGTPVTADDFIFGWQRAVDPDVASEYSYLFSDIGQIKNAAEIIAGEKEVTELGVSAPDDHTLVVELNVPVSYFLSLMYFPTFYPVNREFYESTGGEGKYATSADTLLSNGAFVMESYEPAALNFNLVKNPDYYAADQVQLDGLNYQVIKDSQQALMAYQNGTLDIVKLSGDQVDQVKEDPELSVHGAGYLWYLTMNVHDIPDLDNLNLRMAFTHAVDREAIVNNVVKDGSIATYTAVPPQFATSPVDGSDFSEDQEMFSEYCTYDLEKATEYYEAAKKELGKDTFEFDLLCEDQTETQRVATVIKEQIEKALPGVTMNIVVEPKKQRLEDIQSGNYEVCLTRWGPDYADPMTYLGMWITDNNNNYGRWSNADYDAIIAECTTGQYVSDPAARWEALYDAEEIVMKEAAIVPVYTKADACMIKSGVEGIEFHPVALNRVYKNATKG